MWFGVVTLFPRMFEAVTLFGVTSRACRNADLSVECFNPRDYADNSYGSVDDRPYGGGPGMLMQVMPLAEAITQSRKAAPIGTKVIVMSPQGEMFDDRLADRLNRAGSAILVAGRYEGIDERVISGMADMELSVGDYVLSGGELAAMCVIDAVARKTQGVLGNDRSAPEDCFSDGLLHFPQYTRPEAIDGNSVPQVLLGGDHKAVARWRHGEALARTYERRKDLLARRVFDKEELSMLDSYLRRRK